MCSELERVWNGAAVVLFGCYPSISLPRQRKATNLSHVGLINVGVNDQVKVEVKLRELVKRVVRRIF